MKIEYNNLYTHFVFTTLHRQPMIPDRNRLRIEKYITGIINRNQCKLYAIYANPEHIHILVSRAPSLDEESLATIIANSSERFINDSKLSEGFFAWQNSCSAFSVSKGDIDRVCKYILNQKVHHQKHNYQEERDKFIQFYQGTLEGRQK